MMASLEINNYYRPIRCSLAPLLSAKMASSPLFSPSTLCLSIQLQFPVAWNIHQKDNIFLLIIAESVWSLKTRVWVSCDWTCFQIQDAKYREKRFIWSVCTSLYQDRRVPHSTFSSVKSNFKCGFYHFLTLAFHTWSWSHCQEIFPCV